MCMKATVPFIVLLGVCCALDFTRQIPGTSTCGLSYGTVLEKRSWVCEDSQYAIYPKDRVDGLLFLDKYKKERAYLSVTNGCQSYSDSAIDGKNDYYTYESICKTKRRAIRVIWASVPDYKVPADLMGLRSGLLPCHVLEGQSLFDVECVHPWADGVPQHLPAAIRKRLSRIRFTKVKRNLCLAGYAYNYNLVCKPTGFMQREVLVYSEHANKIFSVVIPNVPTSCACAQCSCYHHKIKALHGSVPAVV